MMWQKNGMISIFLLFGAFTAATILNAQSLNETVLWLEKSHKEIEMMGKDGGTVIAPMAQIEAHGPHLPVGTDFYIVAEIARRAAEKSGSIVGPPVLLGNCIDFTSWPGYIVVDNTTFLSLIQNYCRSIRDQGFKKLVFLIQHGGNNANGIRLAVEEYHRDHPEMIILVTTTGMLLGNDAANFRKNNFHMDTAMMLTIRPGLVWMDRLPDTVEVQPLQRRAIPFVKGQSLADMAPDAMFVLPTGSTEADGKEILDIVVTRLVELINYY